jgi:hypothetical protein
MRLPDDMLDPNTAEKTPPILKQVSQPGTKEWPASTAPCWTKDIAQRRSSRIAELAMPTEERRQRPLCLPAWVYSPFSPRRCGQTNQADGCVGFGKGAGPDRKDVLHPRGDREGGVDSSDAGIAHEADGVVEKDFIAADETEQRRKSGEIGEDGRSKGLRGIGTVQIGDGHVEQTSSGAFDIDRRAARHALATAGEIGPGRDRDNPSAHRQVAIAQGYGCGHSQAAPGGITAEECSGRFAALIEQPLPGSHGILDRGWEWMLGREPVIRHQEPGAGSKSEMTGRLSPGGGSTGHVSAAKTVEDRPRRTFALDCSPEAINSGAGE